MYIVAHLRHIPDATFFIVGQSYVKDDIHFATPAASIQVGYKCIPILFLNQPGFWLVQNRRKIILPLKIILYIICSLKLFYKIIYKPLIS